MRPQALNPLRQASQRLNLLKRTARHLSTAAPAAESKWYAGWRKWLVAGTTGVTGYFIGSSNYPHFSRPRDAADIQHEIDTVPEYKYIYNHPFTKQLRADPNIVESRYHDRIPLLHRDNMLTTGLLAGKGMLTVEPIIFRNKETGHCFFFYHVGTKLDGHDGIVHGGLLATLIDEGLTRCGFPYLPSKYGVTGNLNLNYRAPVRADSYIVLETSVTEVKGRKVVVKGHLRALSDNKPELSMLLVESDVVLVEPKWAKYFTWLINKD
ncbi:hypothetical protein D0Z00_000247 [Geotrichum galactomycetum]|uniref:Uncharacterized protein n=1 Tax=Geotrichum galactomycetum TaxID=27317 RepID=A0ACB6VAC7_9ASCO|nr:hypothetical protein D0Z00_000247 [Geotrichum candidum]